MIIDKIKTKRIIKKLVKDYMKKGIVADITSVDNIENTIKKNKLDTKINENCKAVLKIRLKNEIEEELHKNLYYYDSLMRGYIHPLKSYDYDFSSKKYYCWKQ